MARRGQETIDGLFRKRRRVVVQKGIRFRRGGGSPVRSNVTAGAMFFAARFPAKGASLVFQTVEDEIVNGFRGRRRFDAGAAAARRINAQCFCHLAPWAIQRRNVSISGSPASGRTRQGHPPGFVRRDPLQQLTRAGSPGTIAASSKVRLSRMPRCRAEGRALSYGSGPGR